MGLITISWVTKLTQLLFNLRIKKTFKRWRSLTWWTCKFSFLSKCKASSLLFFLISERGAVVILHSALVMIILYPHPPLLHVPLFNRVMLLFLGDILPQVAEKCATGLEELALMLMTLAHQTGYDASIMTMTVIWRPTTAAVASQSLVRLISLI